MYAHQKNKGLIKLIILIVLGVLVLSYFNFDIKSFIDQPTTQKNIEYIVEGAKYVWNEHLASPVLYFWNNIFIDLLWSSFVDNLERIKVGEPHDFELNAPVITR
ncbi:MAG: hypothetical protein WD003_00665 [Candidatus Paceibacterota bacterium]